MPHYRSSSTLSVLSPSHVQLRNPMDISPPCPSSSPEACPSSCPLLWWWHPAISLSDVLFSFCPWYFPGSGTFPMSWLFTSDDQNTRASASASVLPVIIQGWSPLKLSGLISLLSGGLSEVFTTTVWRHKFFGVPLALLSSSLNHMWPLGLDYTDLCQQE